MRRQGLALILAFYLISRAARHRPTETRATQQEEWEAEVSAILANDKVAFPWRIAETVWYVGGILRCSRPESWSRIAKRETAALEKNRFTRNGLSATSVALSILDDIRTAIAFAVAIGSFLLAADLIFRCGLAPIPITVALGSVTVSAFAAKIAASRIRHAQVSNNSSSRER